MSRNCFGILLCLLCCGTLSAHLQPYGLVGAWDFENGWTDVSGVAPLYTGTTAGQVAITTDPVRGKVATCTGNGRVSFGPSSGGKLDIPDAVSMCCWMKINKSLTANATWLPIMGKGPGGYRMFLHGEQSNGTPGWTFAMFQYGLIGGYMWPGGAIYDANVWLHVGCSYDGDYNRFYINGQLVAALQCEDFNSIVGWKRDLWSGTACPYYFSIFGLSGYSLYFKGSLDDVAVYHGVLYAQDFNDIYTGRKTIHQVTPKPPAGTFSWDESLIAAYSFEGNTAELSPGPAADGILNNGAVIVSDPNQGNVLYGTPGDPNWYVDCGKAAKFDNVGLTTGAYDGFTMTAWIKPDANNPPGWAIIAEKGGTGYRMFYHSIDPSTGGRTLGGMVDAGDTPTNQSMGNGGNMQPGQWYHVAIVYDPNHPAGYNPADPNTDVLPGTPAGSLNDPNYWPGRIWGYVDGQAAFGHPDPSVSPNHLRGPLRNTSADPLTIRTALGGFNGKIDEVRIYNRRLTQLEVRGVMQQKCAPSMIGADYTGDCSVDYRDVQVLTSQWLNRYNLRNFSRLAQVWLNQNMLWPYSN